MVGLEGHNQINYDIYNNPINTSIEPDYGYNNFYDGNQQNPIYG